MNTWYSAVVEAERTAFGAVALPLWAQGHSQQSCTPSALYPTNVLAPGHTFFVVVLFCLKQLLISQADLKFDL